MDCQNIVSTSAYDLYKLSNDPPPPALPAPPPQAFELVHDGGECSSSDAGLPSSDSVEECAAHCAAANGCEFFSYNAGNKYCFHEFTTSRDCPEGFEVDGYDFYALVDGVPSPPPPAPSPPPPSAPPVYFTVDGPCTVNGACVRSPNYPSNYGSSQSCIKQKGSCS